MGFCALIGFCLIIVKNMGNNGFATIVLDCYIVAFTIVCVFIGCLLSDTMFLCFRPLTDEEEVPVVQHQIVDAPKMQISRNFARFV
ncbi:hypothetical protein M3Y98_00910500 [Aphelenchoides besseyi]|nr:hypothetical protein M3Y98_00910500 [Aphelenchoides besseyi]